MIKLYLINFVGGYNMDENQNIPEDVNEHKTELANEAPVNVETSGTESSGELSNTIPVMVESTTTTYEDPNPVQSTGYVVPQDVIQSQNQQTQSENSQTQNQQTQSNNGQAQPNYAQGTGYNSNYTQEFDTTPMSMGDWLLTLLVLLIPCGVGIVFYFIWAFGKQGNVNRRNYCRAALIVSGISLLISIIFFAFFAAGISSAVGGFSF